MVLNEDVRNGSESLDLRDVISYPPCGHCRFLYGHCRFLYGHCMVNYVSYYM
jgi:hypothetical protein